MAFVAMPVAPQRRIRSMKIRILPGLIGALLAAATLLPSLAQAQAQAAAAAASERAVPGTFSGRYLAVQPTSGKVVGLYVPNWEPTARLDALPAGSATHLLYAFLRICGPGQLPKDEAVCQGRADFQLASGEPERTFDTAFQAFKQRAPQVKVLASVGGWGGSDPFFHLANDAARRAAFAASTVDFLRTHRAFDGIDIDWEHPTSNGSANGVALGAPADGQGYADLMLELRRALDALGREQGRRYLLTSAVNTTDAIVGKVNFKGAQPALDLLFMMTYDFYGPWTKQAGHHSPLRDSPAGANNSLQGAFEALRRAGMPAHKLVAGVAMYGRGFTGVRLPAGGGLNGAARDGVFNGSDGSMPYREIAASMLDAQGRGRNGFEARFDPLTQAWSLWNPGSAQLMGYDDPRAVTAKARWARRQGLAGVFAWEYSQDNGDLLNAMNRGIGNAVGAPAIAGGATGQPAKAVR